MTRTRDEATSIAVTTAPNSMCSGRSVAVDALSAERLASLRRIRHSLSAKVVAAYDGPFWRERSQNGVAYSDGVLGSTWPQTHGVLSALVAPERLSFFLASDPAADRNSCAPSWSGSTAVVRRTRWR